MRSRQKNRAKLSDKQKKRNLKVKIINRSPQDEAKQRRDRAKMLTNDRELWKAFATMIQRGVAPAKKNIMIQVKAKFPLRKNRVVSSSKENDNLRNLAIRKLMGRALAEQIRWRVDGLTKDH